VCGKAALLVGQSWDQFPVVSLDFSVTYSFRPYLGPGVDSAPRENEYQEHFLGVKAASVWGWRPHHLHVLNVVEIWEPKPPGTLWACCGTALPFFSFTVCRMVVSYSLKKLCDQESTCTCEGWILDIKELNAIGQECSQSAQSRGLWKAGHVS
jgi:hypothetical protein